jgi:hypothetical protein
MIVATTVAATLACAHRAEAREHHHRHAHHHRYAVDRHDQETWHPDQDTWHPGRVYDDASAGFNQRYSQQWSADSAAGTRRGGLGGRPSA